MDDRSGESDDVLGTGSAFRQLVIFQFKLALDALRDFALSPLSIGAFVVDSLTRPRFEDSLTYRMLLLGRRSDRVINLFGEFSEEEHYTVDRTLGSVEQAMASRRRNPSARGREEGR